MRTRLPLPLVAPCALALVAGLLVASSSASGEHRARRPECTITGTNHDDELHGTSGADVICALGGDDYVQGRGGNDVIYGGRGNGALFGGNGDDRIHGGPEGDDLVAERGDDRLFGRGGNDVLWADELYGEAPGADVLLGGRGRDGLYAIDGKGDDRLLGGPRRDHYCADPGDVLHSVEHDIAPCFDD